MIEEEKQDSHTTVILAVCEHGVKKKRYVVLKRCLERNQSPRLLTLHYTARHSRFDPTSLPPRIVMENRSVR